MILVPLLSAPVLVSVPKVRNLVNPDALATTVSPEELAK